MLAGKTMPQLSGRDCIVWCIRNMRKLQNKQLLKYWEYFNDFQAFVIPTLRL